MLFELADDDDWEFADECPPPTPPLAEALPEDCPFADAPPPPPPPETLALDDDSELAFEPPPKGPVPTGKPLLSTDDPDGNICVFAGPDGAENGPVPKKFALACAAELASALAFPPPRNEFTFA